MLQELRRTEKALSGPRSLSAGNNLYRTLPLAPWPWEESLHASSSQGTLGQGAQGKLQLERPSCVLENFPGHRSELFQGQTKC